MRRYGLVVGVVFIAGLGGCAQLYEPTVRTSDVIPNKIISNTSSLSHVFVRDDTKHYFLCSQPQPDTGFDQAEAADFSIFGPGGGDSSGESENSGEVELAGRTPGVLMTRELFYRACEFSQNYRLTKEEALTLYNKTLDTVSTVWATEAGNTTVTVGDTVENTSSTNQSSKITDSVNANTNTKGSETPTNGSETPTYTDDET